MTFTTPIDDPWSGRDTRNEARLELDNVFSIAVNNVMIFGDLIGNVCETFKNFAVTEIENAEVDDVAWPLVSGAVRNCITLLLDQIPGGAAVERRLRGTAAQTTLGREVAGRIGSSITDAFEDLWSEDPPERLSKGELQQFIRELAQAGNALSVQYVTSAPGGNRQTQPQSIIRQFAETLSALQQNLMNDNRPGVERSRAQAEMLYWFYQTDTSEKIAILNDVYKIPMPERSETVATNFYEAMLDEFGRVYAEYVSSRQDLSIHATHNRLYRGAKLEAHWAFIDNGRRYRQRGNRPGSSIAESAARRAR